MAIIAVLEILLGIFSSSGGLLVIFGGGLAGLAGVAFLAALAVLGVLLLLGLVSFGVGIGLWMGRGWARTLGIVFSIIGILNGLLSVLLGSSGSFVVLLINLLILYYLTRPEVKAFFEKGPEGKPAMAGTPLH